MLSLQYIISSGNFPSPVLASKRPVNNKLKQRAGPSITNLPIAKPRNFTLVTTMTLTSDRIIWIVFGSVSGVAGVAIFAVWIYCAVSTKFLVNTGMWRKSPPPTTFDSASSMESGETSRDSLDIPRLPSLTPSEEVKNIMKRVAPSIASTDSESSSVSLLRRFLATNFLRDASKGNHMQHTSSGPGNVSHQRQQDVKDQPKDNAVFVVGGDDEEERPISASSAEKRVVDRVKARWVNGVPDRVTRRFPETSQKGLDKLDEATKPRRTTSLKFGSGKSMAAMYRSQSF